MEETLPVTYNSFLHNWFIFFIFGYSSPFVFDLRNILVKVLVVIDQDTFLEKSVYFINIFIISLGKNNLAYNLKTMNHNVFLVQF